MKFHYQARYLKLPSKLKKFDELPIIPIQLETGVTVLCLVDSGASKSYIHGKFGDHLGLDVESGNKFTSEGVTGHKFVSYIHKIKI